ncbi:MAG: UDP-N-acetylmuramoyl-tripeptide--D-alanyl-D-alanine ligase [Actinomycetota bacterium]
MKFVLSSLANDLGGRLVGPDRTVDGAAIDSRGEVDGRLFVPIVAERDGHDFVAAAIDGGAAAYLTARPPDPAVDAPAIVVDDTASALTALGRLARSRLTGPVVGITGSVGKTSVKDLTLAACVGGGSAWASVASFNNELGVPLTLANAPEGSGVTIVEMGARGIGHIAELCAVARPTIGVVTRVALVHSELFGSIDDVARGKGELVEALPAGGTAVLNADDPLVAAMADRTGASVLTYGAGAGDDDGGPPADRPSVRLLDVRVDRLLRPTFLVEAENPTEPGINRAELTLDVRGAHMASNATAALATALAAGVPFDVAIDGLRAASVSPWRMEVLEAPGGALVINDAYNANPTSMRAAFRSLVEVPAERRVAVVGLMAELGPEGPREHLALADEAVEAGIELIAVDAPQYGDRARHVADRDGAAAAIGPLGSGDAVLVKGSRVAGLERLAAELLER